MKTKAPILISAAAGGIAPNIVRIAIAALSQQTFAVPSVARMLTYSVGLAVMAGSGAFMAWIYDEKEKKKAFSLGMSLPAMLQLTFTNLSSAAPSNPNPEPPAQVSLHHVDFVPNAYADSTPVTSRLSKRLLHLTVENPQGSEEVTFYSNDGRKKQSQVLASPAATVAVPDFADYCTVRTKGAVSAPSPIPAAPVSDVTATIQENNWSGFWQALGSNGKAPYKVILKSKEP